MNTLSEFGCLQQVTTYLSFWHYVLICVRCIEPGHYQSSISTKFIAFLMNSTAEAPRQLKLRPCLVDCLSQAGGYSCNQRRTVMTTQSRVWDIAENEIIPRYQISLIIGGQYTPIPLSRRTLDMKDLIVAFCPYSLPRTSSAPRKKEEDDEKK
jgi:hypothetical protein